MYRKGIWAVLLRLNGAYPNQGPFCFGAVLPLTTTFHRKNSNFRNRPAGSALAASANCGTSLCCPVLTILTPPNSLWDQKVTGSNPAAPINVTIAGRFGDRPAVRAVFPSQEMAGVSFVSPVVAATLPARADAAHRAGELQPALEGRGAWVGCNAQRPLLFHPD